MSEDIVKALRKLDFDTPSPWDVCCDAADEIERLTAERDAAIARAEKAEGLLLDAYNTWGEWPQETLTRIADFLNKGGGMSVRDILDQLRDPKCKFSREQVADEIERLRAERDALRAELAAAKNDERRKWVKALLEVLPEEKAVLFREICVARDKLEKIKGGGDE